MVHPRSGTGAVAVAIATFFASAVRGQAIWTIADQVSTNICQWGQLRATVIHDTLYMDGGELWWSPGLSDGTIAPPIRDGNPTGLMYTLNFSMPFNVTQNITALLGTISKAPNGGFADSFAPNYVDGALLGNDAEFFLFGGLLAPSTGRAEPPGDTALVYRKFQYGAPKELFVNGSFDNYQLGDNTTRYITYGGAANAPSENRAWYFSGMRSRNGSTIHVPSGALPSTSADVVSNTLVTVDFGEQFSETFQTTPLPSSVPGRANPELVWVPVGARGILVALGGVVFPDFVSPLLDSDNATASRAQSPGFMTTIDIYDVESGRWFRQRTGPGGPGQLTRGCAVVAPAQDASSFNIYWYGGYDGLNATNPFSDDVWVLSIPSFTWTKVASGSTTGGGRAGHKCVMPYPDQMLVVGGYPNLVLNGPLPCLKETIRVFNLSSAQWLPRYDPSVYGSYQVPAAVRDKIGGSPTGGATASTPSPSFDSGDLARVFATAYPTSKLVSHWPYPSAGVGDNTNPLVPPSDNNGGGGGGLPSYLPPVLGVVLGLVLITLIVVLVLLWRRRRMVFRTGASDAGTTTTNGQRILMWMRGTQPAEAKEQTVTSVDETTPASTADLESVSGPQHSSIPEMMDTAIRPMVELPTNTPPAELHDSPLNHKEIINRYSHLGESPALGTLHNGGPGSFYSSGTNQVDHASTLSRSTGPQVSSADTPTPPPPAHNPSHYPHYQPSFPATISELPDYTGYYRPDSDALGDPATAGPMSTTPTSTVANAAAAATTRGHHGLSGISNISERDRVHLRQISDTTVSSVNSGPAGDRILSPLGPERIVESPMVLSPPSSGYAEGTDYLSARPVGGSGSASSPLRRSVFTESREDMNGDGTGNGNTRGA